MSIDEAYQLLYRIALICFLILIAAVLVRSVIGPRITDRILSINMLGTMVISSIAILSRMLEETYLLDVALIYTMISFITVLMMATMYIPSKPARGKFPSQAADVKTFLSAAGTETPERPEDPGSGQKGRSAGADAD